MHRLTPTDSGWTRGGLWLAILWGGLALSTAHAEDELPGTSEAIVDSNRVSARQRPSFMLPDIVVEGEDLSRLTGGMRLLEIEMPGLRPEQQPLIVAPGPTRYARRFARPFETALPQPETMSHPRGHLAVAAEAGYGGELSFAALGTETHLLWGDLAGWSERIAARDHLEIGLGWLRARPAANPRRRFSVGIDYLIDRHRELSLADTTGLGGSDPRIDVEQKLLVGGVLWEGLTRAWGGRYVLRARAHGGELRTSWRPLRVPAEKPVGRWIRGSLGITSFGTRRDLVAFQPDYGEAIRPDVDLRAGWALRQGAADSTRQSLRWQGHLGWSRLWGSARLGIGAGSGGNHDHQVIGPWLAIEHRGAQGKLRLRFESEPRALFAEENLAAGIRLHPGGAASPGNLFSTWERALVGHRAQRRDHIPGEMRRALPLPVPVQFDPRVDPQTTLAHLAGELLLLGERAWLRLRAQGAHWEHTLSWQARDLANGPVGYTLVNLEEPRWRTDLETEVRVRFARSFEWVLTHAWRRDDAPTPAQEILFLPEHEASVLVGGCGERWLYGVRLNYRQSAPSTGEDELGESLFWSAAVGWTFGAARVLLIGENLLDEEIITLPGVGIAERRVRVVWEKTFFGRTS